MPLLHGGENDLRAALYAAVVAGDMRIVAADGTDTVVTSPADIGVGSTTMRLAKPAADDERPEGAPDTTQEESTNSHSAPRTAPTGAAPGGAPAPSPRTTEVQIRFTLNSGMTDRARQNAVYRLAKQLALAVDAASHVQMTVAVVVPEHEADTLEPLIADAGGTPMTRAPVD